MAVTVFPSSKAPVKLARRTFGSLPVNSTFRFYGQTYVKVAADMSYCISHQKLVKFGKVCDGCRFDRFAMVVPLADFTTFQA